MLKLAQVVLFLAITDADRSRTFYEDVLGLTFMNENDYNLIQEDDTFNFVDLEAFAPGKPLTIEVVHADGSVDVVMTKHTYNEQQISWYRAGSALNMIKEENAK